MFKVIKKVFNRFNIINIKTSLVTSCLLVLLSQLFFACSKNETVNFPKDLNVVLIITDTIGKHQIGYYGAEASTPNLDKLIKNGVHFTNTFSSASWTKPAIASILTGYLPNVHLVRSLGGKIRAEIETLAEYFQKNGFQTAGFVSHTLLAKKYGYGQGFETYENLNPTNPHVTITSDKVSDSAIEWLKNRNNERNFFLQLHYFDTHSNYRHHEKYDKTSWYNGKIEATEYGVHIDTLRHVRKQMDANDLKYVKGLFGEETAFEDEQIGRFISYLEESPYAKNTLIVWVSDHGEAFLERGKIGHSVTLYNELIKVPFVFYMPSLLKPREVKEPVAPVDIFPTLAKIVNQDWDENRAGFSLLPVLAGSKLSSDRVTYNETLRNSNLAAVEKNGYKLIHNKKKNRYALYNLESDPLEKNNIISTHPAIFEELKVFLDNYEKSDVNSKEDNVELTPVEVKQLESLGYM